MYNGIYLKDQYAYIYDSLFKWMTLKVNGKDLGVQLREKGTIRAAVYGCNDFGKLVYEDIKKTVCVQAFIDKRATDVKVVDKIEVILPQSAIKLPEDCYIIITPEYYFREISEDLLTYGIREDRLISIAMVLA